MCIRDRCVCVRARVCVSNRNKITYFRWSLESSWILQVYCYLKGTDEYYLIPLPFSEICKFHFEMFYYACSSPFAHGSLANNPLYYLRISHLFGTNALRRNKRIWLYTTVNNKVEYDYESETPAVYMRKHGMYNVSGLIRKQHFL